MHTVHRMACIVPLPLVCKRDTENDDIFGKLDTVHKTVHFATISVCKRSNDMDRTGLLWPMGRGTHKCLHCANTVGVQENCRAGHEKGLHCLIGHRTPNG